MNENIRDEKKLLSALGMCAKAGKIIFGVPMICEAMRRGGKGIPVLVIESADTSDNTHKKINDKCAYYKVKHYKILTDGEKLAQALGKTGALAAVGITDKNLSIMVEQNF